MQTRPLAFKGPVDHLSQCFELQTLYQGMQLLLQDGLVDWQLQTENELVAGIFVEQERLIRCQLMWPLVPREDNSHCNCQQLSDNLDNRQAFSMPVLTAEPAQDLNDDARVSKHCHHLAALAIESKMRLERLPQPINPASQVADNLTYLSEWLSKQAFDPFPNMARHRVVYILDGDEDFFQISVHKAYLTQQNEYQRKGELDWRIVERDNLPKFISLTDQHIFHQLQQIIGDSPSMALSSHQFTLQFPQCETLLASIVKSNRCFWRSCHRQPIGWQITHQAQDEAVFLCEKLRFDKSRNRILQLAQFLANRATELFRLVSTSPDIAIEANINITTEAIHFPWLTQPLAQLPNGEIDMALIHFKVAGIRFTLEEILAWCEPKPARQQAIFLERIAALIHQLDWMPSLAASFETPIWNTYDIASRYLEGDLSHWFVLFRALQVNGWRVAFTNAFQLNQKLADNWYSRVRLANNQERAKNRQASSNASRLRGADESSDWFELELGVVIDGHPVNILPFIVQALRRGQWQESQLNQRQTIILEDGTRIQLSNERLQNILANLVELWENRPLNRHQRLKLPASQFSRLLSLEKQLNQATEWEDLDWLKQKSKRLNRLTRLVSLDPPTEVKATLREYQKQGVYWLQVLREEGLGGVLADDMGLGKTIQTLAHIQLEKNNGRLASPCMVVAPTSLLGNWHAEAQRFTPQLKVLRWSGSKRYQYQSDLHSCDLIITSYGVLARDVELLNSLNLYLLILDEAQTIKNTRSRVARLSYQLQATHRLCLTGTPLENHLGELWSLYHFLMPGFLGDEAQFKRLFQQPIEKEHDSQRQKVLSQRIAPFMLRRTKALVARDLPEKTVIDEYIELTERQADLYESTRLAMLEEVQQILHSDGRQPNQLLIGNALLRLRQICCHPLLIKKSNSGKPALTADSAKLDWLMTVLPEMLESGQKILIFSSFTSMLDIIGEQLTKDAIPYLLLTGKTRRRSDLVARFQAGEVPVFLISLKAGGAGLNLTQADTVIHFDPWWNPAAEAQASDRAHRIGQNKRVFVYKLISKGTVEERIQFMQQHKQQLADQVYRAQRKTTLLDGSDWEKLLAPLEPAS